MSLEIILCNECVLSLLTSLYDIDPSGIILYSPAGISLPTLCIPDLYVLTDGVTGAGEGVGEDCVAVVVVTGADAEVSKRLDFFRRPLLLKRRLLIGQTS